MEVNNKELNIWQMEEAAKENESLKFLTPGLTIIKPVDAWMGIWEVDNQEPHGVFRIKTLREAFGDDAKYLVVH